MSTNQVALITGASRALGLGVATARLLAEQGYHVILTARDAAQAEAQASVLRAEGHSAEGWPLDLTDPDGPARIADRLRIRHGHLDVLVSNASCMPDGDTRSALEVDLGVARIALETNVLGVWGLIQALRPALAAAPLARVVNVSSAAAEQIAAGADFPDPVRAPAHSLSKHLLNVLTATLAAAFRGTGIRVNAVDPGRVATHPERGDDALDRSPAEAAAWVVWAATLPADGPNGGVFLDGHRIA